MKYHIIKRHKVQGDGSVGLVVRPKAYTINRLNRSSFEKAEQPLWNTGRKFYFDMEIIL